MNQWIFKKWKIGGGVVNLNKNIKIITEKINIGKKNTNIYIILYLSIYIDIGVMIIALGVMIISMGVMIIALGVMIIVMGVMIIAFGQKFKQFNKYFFKNSSFQLKNWINSSFT